jgi:hypothetical protein
MQVTSGLKTYMLAAFQCCDTIGTEDLELTFHLSDALLVSGAEERRFHKHSRASPYCVEGKQTNICGQFLWRSFSKVVSSSEIGCSLAKWSLKLNVKLERHESFIFVSHISEETFLVNYVQTLWSLC